MRALWVSLVVLAGCGPQVSVEGGAGGGSAGGAQAADGAGGGTTSAGGGSTAAGGGTTSAGGGSTAAGGGTTSAGGGTTAAGGGTTGTGGGTTAPSPKKVFVIAMENQGTPAVYNAMNAPYLNNTLMVQGGHATMYGDVLGASDLSEPHYVWLEAGTNVFSDHTFTSDGDVSATNSTSSVAHLATQLAALPVPKTWRAYQEGLNTSTGACPIASNGQYAAKHDPFVFFTDVAGSPPSKTNAACAQHHKAFTASGLAADLAANDVADYTFITPNLCNDMHGGLCANGCLGSFTTATCVGAGDTWLAAVVPSILGYLAAHDGVLLIIWDEPESTGTQPFVILGPHVKAGHTSAVTLSHSSYLKSLQKMFGVPVFSGVASANDFSDFFQPGFFP